MSIKVGDEIDIYQEGKRIVIEPAEKLEVETWKNLFSKYNRLYFFNTEEYRYSNLIKYI